ncbi:MAG: CBS domain-containing protein [Chloroflexi bacterium]|jgi:acetoin utilization protein AcuB|nr:CBS domain-containing protein [Chloroflexota bacterium]
MSEEWISTQEAAKQLGVTTARIRQLVAEKKINARKVGGKYRGQWLVKATDIAQRIQKGVSTKMNVKNRMTPNPITASQQTNYNQALRLMQQNNIKHLPIVDSHDKLIGIVTYNDMLRAEPSPVTSLSVFEIASLLEKVTMKQIMNHPVLAIEETCSIANAAKFMLDNDIGCLPVVRDEALVGIITDTDIFKTFVEITGGGQAGTRLEAKVPDQKGQLAALTQALTEAGAYIVLVAISYDDSGDYSYVDLKERGGDEQKIRAELGKLDHVEVLEIRPSDGDQLRSFGK